MQPVQNDYKLRSFMPRRKVYNDVKLWRPMQPQHSRKSAMAWNYDATSDILHGLR